MEARLLEFLQIDDSHRSQAARLWAILEPNVNAIVAEFYKKVMASRISPRVTAAVVESLKRRQREHWDKLFHSKFDEAYANSARRVGIRHRDIELDPMWYVAGYAVMKVEFTRIVASANMADSERVALLETLEKYVALDMALSLSAFSFAADFID
jgi:hypothetical protein